VLRSLGLIDYELRIGNGDFFKKQITAVQFALLFTGESPVKWLPISSSKNLTGKAQIKAGTIFRFGRHFAGQAHLHSEQEQFPHQAMHIGKFYLFDQQRC
jgi:hypothetical protein